jgi:hypothetical protein
MDVDIGGAVGVRGIDPPPTTFSQSTFSPFEQHAKDTSLLDLFGTEIREPLRFDDDEVKKFDEWASF